MIAVIGAGKVGSALAFNLAQRGLDEIVLADIAPGLAQGEALDMAQTCLLPVRVRGTDRIEEIKGAGVVVIAAGEARKPGMSRLDLAEKNVSVVREICGKVKELAPDSVVIVVTNPLDVMIWVALKAAGFRKERVIGVGSFTDSLRFRYFLAQELGTGVDKVEAMVLGEHGDSMVPLVSQARAGGKPVKELLSKEQLDQVLKRTREGGAEVVRLKGYTSWTPGETVARTVEAILKDTGEVLPVSMGLEGEFGLERVCIGVPVRLGRNGVKEIVELELEELEQLRRSGAIVKKKIEGLG